MDTDKAIFMKILIVEDEPSLRELMQKTLAKERYVVETAGTFHEANLKIADYSYDCILLDIMLPDGNGLKLLEMLKELELLKKEYDILFYFANRPNHIIDKAVLAEAVWGDHIDQADSFHFVYAQVKNLRQQLKKAGATIEIRSIYGFGYKLVINEEE